MIRRAICIAVGAAVGLAGAAATACGVRWRRARDRRWTAHADAVAAEIQARADRGINVT